MPVSKVDIPTFAKAVKDKYPQYKDVNDTDLTKAIIDKHPEYKDKVDLSGIDKPASSVDKGIDKTTDKVNQEIQYNGTFKPDLEGEKKGIYTEDPDYQKQKADFVSKIYTDVKGNLSYPEQDAKGNWVNYYTKEPIVNFDPHEMRGKILQVPHEYLPATGGKKFISPVYNQKTGAYEFTEVQTPDVPHEQTLPEATVYGKKRDELQENGTLEGLSPEVNAIIDESDKQGGRFKDVLRKNPSLSGDIDNTIKKYGEPYKHSLGTGSEAMANVLQKTVEDKFNLNKPLPDNVDPAILNGHLDVLNNFDKNRKGFETNQKELQRQADLITDKAKREGTPVSQEDADRINQKSQKNIDNWNEYTKAVKFAQNYVSQPEVKGYLAEFKKRQSGLQLMDEINQRSFPSQIAAQVKQDEYDRKAIEGNLNVWDYIKTAGGAATKGLLNMGETTMKMAPMALSGGLVQFSDKGNAAIEKMNNTAQQFIGANLPSISPEAIKEMDKKGMGHLVNDLSGTIGGFAPYLIPGMVGEGLGAKAATFATALTESLPNVRKEAEKEGLTGDAYNTFITAKPLVTAAFMTLLPSAKLAKGFDSDIAKAIVDGEFNSPKRFLLNLASKALKEPGDIAHLQAMLSGTAIGENIVNQVTNALQAKDDISKGISRKEGLPVDYSNIINPRQTAVMALAAKVMETVPTLKNTIGDFRAGKDIAETYDHIQNNLVELAAHNLEGVSNEVDKMVKKDPGNIYAQHLKNTIQDFAYAKTRMPEGLEPEQEAALFDIQKQVSQKQRQYSTADPVYQPHLQKNIEELNKQIPEILKDPKKAIDYLKDAHKDFTESVLSPKIEENGKETEANAQTQGEGVLEKPEGAGATDSGAAPSYQISRHADTIKDEEGKVSGPNQHPLSEAGKKDANDLATEVAAKAESTGVPITKIVHSGLERSAETANVVANKVKAKTVSDPDLNTWGIGDFDDFKDNEFKEVQKWFVEHPDEKVYGGDLEAAKGKSLDETFNEYAKRTIAAHEKYANEPASTLLIDHSNNMMVMDAYRKNGNKWDEKAAKDYLNSGKPEPATLVQKSNISYPKITNVKLKANALPIGQSETVGTHSDGDTSIGGSVEGGGVGPSIEGEGPAGESSKKEEGEGKEGEVGPGQPAVAEPPKPPENDLPFIEEEGDNEFTSTKNEMTKQKVEDAGLVPAMQEAARDFGTVWKEAQKKLNKGFDIEGLLKTLAKKPRAVTDLENAMILFHQNVKESQLDAASKELDQARKEGDRDKWNDAYGTRARLLDDLQDIYNVDKAIGRETARGLNARKMMVDRMFSLVNMQLEKRASAGGEPLTDEQTAKVQKQYEDIKAAKEALDTRVEELQKENAKLKAEKAVGAQSKATGKTRKTKEQYGQERKDIIQKMRDDLLKAAKGGEGLTSSIPLAAQLKAVAPHIKKLVENFIGQGIDKLEDITKGIHALLSPVIPDIEDRHIHDLIAGEFNEPASPTKELTQEQKDKKEKAEKYQQVKEGAKVQKYRATDPKLMKLQAEYEKAKEKFEQDLKKDQLKTRTGFQKLQDSFLKYERFAKLSNPITLGKLSMAALTRLSTTPIEEGVGAIYSAAFPGLAKKAPGEAGFHVNALAKGYKAAFMRGLDDAATVAKGGKTDIEAVYGKKGHLPPEAIDFFGQLHSAIKAPVKRFAFERSFEKRMANNIKNGTPIDGMVEARIAMEAYKDAQRSIFMQDNAVSRGWSMLVQGLERSDTPGAKELATGLQWLIPFVKVPTNIVGETISHVAGPEIALAKILHTGLTKGLKNLSQDEAESIMRNLKKGTIGHGALMLGYLNPQAFGGYYQEKEKVKEGDVKFGNAKILGHTIPAWMLEAPIFQAMQLGATVRRVQDKVVKGQTQGLGAGVAAGAMGLLLHEPLLDEPGRVADALKNTNSMKYFLGELAKSTLVPAAADYAAKVLDPADKRPTGEKLMEPENKRKPGTIVEHVESAVPGLREKVPEKTATPHKQRQHKPSM